MGGREGRYVLVIQPARRGMGAWSISSPPAAFSVALTIEHSCVRQRTYRAAHVLSPSNVDVSGRFRIESDLPIEVPVWQMGAIVGPSGSGSGSTSLGTAAWGPLALWQPSWPADAPIVGASALQGAFNDITAAL